MASTADACRLVAQACERADFAGAVQVLREHAASAAVQQAGFNTLVRITGADDHECSVRVVAAGALDAVLAAMATHRNNALLLAPCCTLLVNLAKTAPSAVAARAAEAAVAGMRAHAAVPHVQFHGCKALTALAFCFDDVRATAAASGAFEAVVAALVAHEADYQVQDAACGALRNLINDRSLNAVKAASAGAVEALTAALRAHPACAEVQRSGCQAIVNLTAALPGPLTPACPVHRVCATPLRLLAL
jgi:hypothetical protein